MGLFGNHKHYKEKKEIVFIENTEIIKIEDDFYKRHYPGEDERLEKIIERLVGIIDKLTKPSQHENVRLILTTILNNNNSILEIMALNLNVGQSSTDVLGLIDTDKNVPVVATFANVSFTSSDPTIFTTTQDPSNPNQSVDTAVAAGTANLVVTADASYTDANTGQAVTKTGLSVTVPMTVTAVVAGENVALTITQGTPTP